MNQNLANTRVMGLPSRWIYLTTTFFLVLSGILVSGALLVIRNLTGTNFAPELIIFLDLIHLGLVMMFVFVSLYCLIFKKHWTTER